MIEAFRGGLEIMGDPTVVGVILLGSLIGFVFGLIPGLGGIQALALVMPFTFGWDPILAMFFYAGIMGSVSEGGSVSAILLNTPGSAINAASCFDGYPMARRGEAGRALGLAAASSSLGALFGVVVLLLLIPAVRPIVLAFGPPEFFWLVLFGLVTITFAARGNLFKGLAAGGLGILLSLIGYSDVFGVLRWTGGSEYLWDGLELVPFFIGIFAISELIVYTTRGGTIATEGTEHFLVKGLGQVFHGAAEVFRYPLTFLRGSIIGTVIGLIPGIGGSVANFISYTTAIHTSKNPALFGAGNPEGVVASESANDAKDGGSLLPTLAFGVPGSAEMAVLLGALTLHGIQPGPLVILHHLDIVVALVLGLVASNLMAGIFLLFSGNNLARVTFVPVAYIAPVVLILAAVGAFVLRNNIWDVAIAFGAGFFGFALKRFGFPVITLAIGFILGVIAERAFHQSLMVAYGSYAIFFTRPICLALVGLIVLTLALPFLGSGGGGKVEASNASEHKRIEAGRVLFTALLFVVVLVMVVGTFSFGMNVRQVPLIVGIPTLLFLLASAGSDLFPNALGGLEAKVEGLWGRLLPEGSRDFDTEDSGTPGSQWLVVEMIGWIGGFFGLVFFFGFLLSTPVFSLLFLRIKGKFGFAGSIVLGVSVFLLLAGFQKAFALELWPGVIPELIPGILGGGITPPF